MQKKDDLITKLAAQFQNINTQIDIIHNQTINEKFTTLEQSIKQENCKQISNGLNNARTIYLKSLDKSLKSILNDLNKLKQKSDEIRSVKQQFKCIEDLSSKLEERLILDNKYTEHSTLSLAQAWDQLDQLGMRMQHNLEQQIQARNQSGVTEQSLREFSMMFKHFDREKTGKLDHDQFKSCLRALGYDLPMVEPGQKDVIFENILDIVDPNRDGFVNLQDYMAFMISRETDNISSVEDVINAFKALTENGDRPYITSEELNVNLPHDQADYCMRKMNPFKDKTGREIFNAFDYEEFTHSLFSN